MHVPGDKAQFDQRRNTSRTKPAEYGSAERALESVRALRRSDPALVKWIEDGHPNLTDEEHYARFGKRYEHGR